MFGLGTPEIIIIVIVILLLFGGKKIPELMRGLGQGVREFNAAKANVKAEIEDGMKNKPAAKEDNAANDTNTNTEEKK